MFLSPGARARRSSSAVSVVVDEQRATAETAITAATHHHPPPPQPVCCLFLSVIFSEGEIVSLFVAKEKDEERDFQISIHAFSWF